MFTPLGPATSGLIRSKREFALEVAGHTQS
jgi:hypothetical protein